MAKLTIILPSYNHAGFLLERLQSVCDQSYKDWEAIIIDDKSTDNSVEIIENFITANPDFKIKWFIINQQNSGSGYNSWKRGIELAETEYIWIAETDDYSALNFLEELVNILEKNKNASLAFCASNYIDNGKIIYDSSKRTKDLNVNEEEYEVINNSIFYKRMPFNTYITNGSCVVFRKPSLAIPDTIFTNRQCSDIFLWSYLLENSSFVFLNKKLNFFRRHEGSTSSFLQKNKLETIYHENAKYLNLFKQTEKYTEFINHYIKFYVWTHKRDFLNTRSIQKIQIDRNLRFIYFYKLIQFTISKVLKR
ncbi:glycosyltransferase family 2 protein [Flavobacterium phragmitis]|uniref:Glycosyltransferase involved in cell wall bisynthesis n=1 Tax=Flavobacterium phragmitis TaxID=739143 RepID=A0A1I1UXC0_9FLAO|nr:glycosyltransferase family 2 protein [Flavobacterium phragmitis]SFD72670.1 Glycosyltransferase involved in cell wall bisynthesis [Flavobacterium phragmitis]